MENMQNIMMKNYKMFAGFGFVVVLIAFIFSLQAADANNVFFSVDKVTREAANPGTNIVAANVARHSLLHWVPAFKFVGLGLLLGAITMALGLIAKTLRELGVDVMSNWPKSLGFRAPEKPRAAKLFPLLMMMGWMILLGGFVWALASNSIVVNYWSNSVATTLNPAAAGSALLAQLGTIARIQPWLSALRYLGMASLFLAITVALTVIIRTLQHQEKTLRKYIKVQVVG